MNKIKGRKKKWEIYEKIVILMSRKSIRANFVCVFYFV